MNKYINIFIAIIGLAIAGCAPDREDDIHLPPAPPAPEFSAEFVQGDSNRVVIQDLSADNFQRYWDVAGASPKSSIKALDTIQYGKAGEYTITLYVSKSDGSGTSFSTKKITIVKDA